jgi:hypothetical protein
MYVGVRKFFAHASVLAGVYDGFYFENFYSTRYSKTSRRSTREIKPSVPLGYSGLFTYQIGKPCVKEKKEGSATSTCPISFLSRTSLTTTTTAENPRPAAVGAPPLGGLAATAVNPNS